jgi:CheY-like chemotaxis protein
MRGPCAVAWRRPAALVAFARVTKVLVCDDEPVMRELIRASLADHGYDIAEAGNGDEALAMVRETRPDILIVDMKMPRRDGVEVVRELRLDPQLATLRIVMLTAMSGEADRRDAERIGVDEFVTKPFIPRELATVVERLAAQRT